MKALLLILLVQLTSTNIFASGCYGTNVRIIDEIPQHYIKSAVEESDLKIRNWYSENYQVTLKIQHNRRNYILSSKSFNYELAKMTYEVVKNKIKNDKELILFWTIQNIEEYDDCDDISDYGERNKYITNIPFNDFSDITLETRYY